MPDFRTRQIPVFQVVRSVMGPLTACGKTHAAFDGRSIPAEPRRFAPLIVAFRSKYTRYSSLTRLVSRAPRPSRRSREFHHRLLTDWALTDWALDRPALADRGQPLSAPVSAPVSAPG